MIIREPFANKFSLKNLYDIRQNYIYNKPVYNSLEDCIQLIQEWLESCEQRTVCTVNFQILMEVYRNHEFAHDLLKNIDFITTQSIPVKWVLKHIGIYFPKRIGTGDIFNSLCQYCSNNHKKIFLVSHRLDLLENVKLKLSGEFPGIQVVGISHIDLCLSEHLNRDSEIVQAINQSGAGLVFVSLPNPEQELWLAKHRHQINAVMFGLGKTFQSYSNNFTPALFLLENLGLIWLYYLMKNPLEFWQCYINFLPNFTCLIFNNHFNDRSSHYTSSKAKGVSRVRELLERIYVPI